LIGSCVAADHLGQPRPIGAFASAGISVLRICGGIDAEISASTVFSDFILGLLRDA
jgi:hypothetical protein